MKNKKTGYFLVPVVLIIWGMIGWKVYAVVLGNDKNAAITSPQSKIESITEIQDTIQLIANYRDPFLDKTSISEENSKLKIQNSKLKIEKISIHPVLQASWPEISYHGLVKHSGSEKAVGFLDINGTTYFVEGGDEAGVVKVGKMWKDSVEVALGKEKRVFRK
jgi:hypothetical protein